MVTTTDDPPELPDEISTLSKKEKHCFSLQPCRISSVQFPEEMLYEVFVRLPVKSLIRFRCVSKGMLRLIDSPIFIKNHNIHRSVTSVYDDEDYAIFLYQPRLHRLFSVSFDKENNYDYNRLFPVSFDNYNLKENNYNLNRGKAIKLNSSFLKEGMKEGMIPTGWSCNGIFCFRSTDPDSQSCVLWNPFNGTFRKVDCESTSFGVVVSMGYDCVNDDYKIIGFILKNNETNLEVYSFRKDSWRKIHTDFPSGSPCSYGNGLTNAVCLSGVMHWLWTDSTDSYIFIAAFDLATEAVTSLPLPLEARQLELEPRHFADFRGRLCITFLPPSYDDGSQTIWVMEKYGVESSWTKLYNFDREYHGRENFYFPNNRRRLLCSFRGWSWWDPYDGSFETIKIPGLLNDQAIFPELYSYEAYVYVRNLVRLDQRELGTSSDLIRES